MWPFRVLLEQVGIVSAVIDDQVYHQAQAQPIRLRNHGADLVFRRLRAFRAQRLVNREIILDGIEASGISRFLDGVDENPVETHFSRIGQMRLPMIECPRQQGEQIIDAHDEPQPGDFSLLLANIIVDVEIILPRILPRIIAAHGVPDRFAKMLGIFVITTDGPAQGGFQPALIHLYNGIVNGPNR